MAGAVVEPGRDRAEEQRQTAEQGAEAVIPITSSRNRPIPYDAVAYRRRNLNERMFGRLKDFRRSATRYDKLARNFLAGVLLAAAFLYWLN